MKKRVPIFFGIAITVCLLIFSINTINQDNKTIAESITHKKNEAGKSPAPNDLWHQIRSYPDGFEVTEYVQNINNIKALAVLNADNRAANLDLAWQQEGPGNIGGRFNALAMDSTQNIIYAGAANGGIFKSIDAGATWNPIFDDYAYLAIGAIAIDPNNTDTVYAGTGDVNFGGGSHLGNGVYKTTDAGQNWQYMGLDETSIITKLRVDPTNSNRVFASTLGNGYEKSNDRGVYRSLDGGSTWANILFLSDSSGVIDLAMDPSNPNILYASGFNRINLPYNSRTKGPEAKIYKSIDGGDSWTQLSGGLPLTEESRIGLAISNEDPNIVYALYVDGDTKNIKDVYKTTNGGTTWNNMDVEFGGVDSDALGGFGWYFGEIYINPYDNDHLVIPGVDMYHSTDGGQSWQLNVPEWWTYEVHADKHAILFLDANSYIIATDGGLYKTDDNGLNWSDIENIPVTQFYHIDVDPHNSGLYGGGAQDNGSMSGNALNFNLWSAYMAETALE